MKNQAKGNEAVFTGKRVVCSHQETINAPRERIFPLACPYAEYDWIDNWQCNIIFTKSGTNEEGCIFTEDMSAPVLFDAPLSTTWVTAVYDSLNCRIRFILVTPGKAVIQYDLEIQEQGRAVSCLNLKFSFTSLCEEVNRMEDEAVTERIMVVVTFLSSALKHYCETGEMLKMDNMP